LVVSTVATNGGYLLWQNPHQSLHVILASACPEPQALWSVQLGLAASGAEWRHRGMPRNLGQRYKVNRSDPWKLEKYPKLGSNYGLYMNIFSREVRSIHYDPLWRFESSSKSRSDSSSQASCKTTSWRNDKTPTQMGWAWYLYNFGNHIMSWGLELIH
jgi:hypothetical protein